MHLGRQTPPQPPPDGELSRRRAELDEREARLAERERAIGGEGNRIVDVHEAEAARTAEPEGGDVAPAEQPDIPAPAAQPSVVSQPLEPARAGTVAPQIEVGGDPRPHPTASPPQDPAELEGETDPAYRGYAGQPILTSGDGGDAVRELCRLLDQAGYSTSVARGESEAVLTNEVYGAVIAFRRDHDVVDELAEQNDKAIADMVGPATWAALGREANNQR